RGGTGGRRRGSRPPGRRGLRGVSPVDAPSAYGGQQSFDRRAVGFGGQGAAAGGFVQVGGEGGAPALDLGPGDLAAADGEEAFAQVADVHARLAVPDEVQPADEQPQHVHDVLPARRAALAQVVFVLAELRL